jgi:hypothetical protein
MESKDRNDQLRTRYSTSIRITFIYAGAIITALPLFAAGAITTYLV